MKRNLLATSLIATLAMSGCATTSSKLSCPLPHGVTCMDAVDVYKATNNADQVNGHPKPVAQPAAQSVTTPARDAPKAPPATYRATPAAPVTTASAQVIVQRPTLAPGATYAGLKQSGPTIAIVAPNKSGVTPLGGSRFMVTVPAAQTSVIAAPVAAPEPTVAPEGKYLTAAYGASGSAVAYRRSAQVMRIYMAPWQDQAGDLHMPGYIYAVVHPQEWDVPTHGMNADDHLLRLVSPGPAAGQGQAPVVQAGQARNAAGPNTSTGGRWTPGSNIPKGEPQPTGR